MSYFDKHLIEGESVVYSTHLHWSVLLRYFLLGVVLLAGGSYIDGINADASLLTLTHSVLTGPGGTGVGIDATHGTAVIENNSISGFEYGMQVDDTVYLSSNTITGNSEGVSMGFTGTAFSRGNNTFAGNGTDVQGALISFAPL